MTLEELKKEAESLTYYDQIGEHDKPMLVIRLEDCLKLIDRAYQEGQKDAELNHAQCYSQKDIEKATLAERKRWQPVIDAWKNEGPVPSYHRNMMYNLKRDWPKLYYAIATAIEKGEVL